jgi:hypothetical protein
MKLITIIAIACILAAFSFSACKSSSGPATFCDTTCLKDSMKFIKESNPLQPSVYISAKDCMADTITWTYLGMGVNRKLSLQDLIGTNVRLNKNFVRCIINDTTNAWLLFNDCSNGRGYSIKIAFDKKKPLLPRSSAINNLDPKFSIAEGLAVYTDRGNIFVEEMTTGRQAMMTFGRDIAPNYNDIHKSIDSVNITPTRIWARVKIEDEWKELEKNITLK